MDEYVIDLLDDIGALRASINQAHFWISQGQSVNALSILSKALSLPTSFREEE